MQSNINANAHPARPMSVYPGALVGWIMDSFDLSMMFLLVPVLSEIFFPQNYGLAIIGTWSIYTTTFIFRPVGGVIFGRLGDKIGRKNSMVITLFGLGIIIFATGFLPTYASIGIAAPIILFLFRIITGIFGGGEYGNSASILTESVSSKRRGIWGAAIQSGYPIGYTLAAVFFLSLHYAFPGTQFNLNGWRWMFWIGIIPVVIGLIVRYKMPESALWSDLNKSSELSKSPVRELFKDRKNLIGTITGMLAMTGIAWVYGLTLGFFPTAFLKENIMAFPEFLYVVIGAILFSLVGYMTSGAVSDRIGRKRMVYIYTIAAIILAIPLTYAIYVSKASPVEIGVFSAILAFLTTGIYGVIPAYLSEKFPTRIRSTGVGLGFNGGFILGNWSTVFLLLIVGFTSPHFYIYLGIFIIIGELFILASALLSEETKGKDLNF